MFNGHGCTNFELGVKLMVPNHKSEEKLANLGEQWHASFSTKRFRLAMPRGLTAYDRIVAFLTDIGRVLRCHAVSHLMTRG